MKFRRHLEIMNKRGKLWVGFGCVVGGDHALRIDFCVVFVLFHPFVARSIKHAGRICRWAVCIQCVPATCISTMQVTFCIGCPPCAAKLEKTVHPSLWHYILMQRSCQQVGISRRAGPGQPTDAFCLITLGVGLHHSYLGSKGLLAACDRPTSISGCCLTHNLIIGCVTVSFGRLVDSWGACALLRSSVDPSSVPV